MTALLQNAEFWVAVGFVILVVAVWKPVGRALSSALDARAQKIKAELDEARSLAEKAAALLAEFEVKQREAVHEAEQILRHAASEAERSRKTAAGELAAALERRERQALERIAQAEAKALAEVRARAVELALAATRRLIRDSLDAARAAELVDRAIAELPQRLQ